MTPQQLLDSFIKHLRIERNFSENTQKAYFSDLKNYLAYLNSNQMDLLQADHQQIMGYLWERKERGLQTSTLCRELEAIKMFYKFLFLEEYTKSDPGTKMISPKIIRRLPSFLTERECEQLLLTIPTRKEVGIRFKAMVELLYATGLRVSELVGLKLSQLDLESGFVRVIGKGKKERIVPLGSAARNAIRNYLSARAQKFQRSSPLAGQRHPKGCSSTSSPLAGKKSGHAAQNNKQRPQMDGEILFLTKFGKQMSRVEFWRQLKNFARKAGISKRVSPHTLRHSFASHLLAGGADLRALQELLGHSSLSTTQMYTHIETKRMKEMHRNYHPRG